MSQMIENLYSFSYATLIVCQHFLLYFLRGRTLPPLVKTSKTCLHLPMENGVFLLEKDGEENSKFGIMCMNESILKISKEKNESSGSFFFVFFFFFFCC